MIDKVSHCGAVCNLIYLFIYLFIYYFIEHLCQNMFHITKYPTLKLMRNGEVSLATFYSCNSSDSFVWQLVRKEYRGQVWISFVISFMISYTPCDLLPRIFVQRSVEALTAFVQKQLTDPIEVTSSYGTIMDKVGVTRERKADRLYHTCLIHVLAVCVCMLYCKGNGLLLILKVMHNTMGSCGICVAENGSTRGMTHTHTHTHTVHVLGKRGGRRYKSNLMAYYLYSWKRESVSLVSSVALTLCSIPHFRR